MARPPKMNETMLLEQLKDYIRVGCGNDITLFTWKSAAEYISSHTGLSITSDNIRRKPLLVSYYNEQKKVFEESENYCITSYKSLDIEQFLKDNNSPAKLRAAISNREEQYRHLSVAAFAQIKQISELENTIEELNEKLIIYKNARNEMSEKLKTLRADQKANREKIKRLEAQLTEWVIDPVATALIKGESPYSEDSVLKENISGIVMPPEDRLFTETSDISSKMLDLIK